MSNNNKKGAQGWLHLVAIALSAIASAFAASQGVVTPEVGAVIGGSANVLVAAFCEYI